MKSSIIKKSLLMMLIIAIAWTSVVFAANVNVTSEEGVPDSAKNDAYIATEKTAAFFATECQLVLDHDVRILIVPNKAAYIQAQIRENKVTPAEAERRAKTTRAWSSKNLIIQNAGDKTLDSQDERIFNISHELVHQYQRQVSGGKHTQLEWMSEGVADAIAAQILELDGRQTIEKFRHQRLEVIRNAKTHPSIASLRQPKDWYSSLDIHGSKVTYRVADIAVLNLLKSATYLDLFDYFSLLKTLDVPTAFRNKIGIALEDYEKSFDLTFSDELNKK